MYCDCTDGSVCIRPHVRDRPCEVACCFRCEHTCGEIQVNVFVSAVAQVSMCSLVRLFYMCVCVEDIG